MRERFDHLRAMGIRTVMVTGDNRLTAAKIAEESGVDDFLAEATPEAKLALIKEQQADGRLVAMTGDGTNAAIKGDNPGAKLPSTTIQTVHRSDESGTTDNFTNYLSRPPRPTGPSARPRRGRPRAATGAKGSDGVAGRSRAPRLHRLHRVVVRRERRPRRWPRSVTARASSPR